MLSRSLLLELSRVFMAEANAAKLSNRAGLQKVANDLAVRAEMMRFEAAADDEGADDDAGREYTGIRATGMASMPRSSASEPTPPERAPRLGGLQSPSPLRGKWRS